MATRLSAHELIHSTVDEGSFTSWDTPVDLPDDEEYRAQVIAAREKSGVDEAVITGQAMIHGHQVALIVGEFRFLGGSIGRATAERIVSAIERATAERLPLIAASSSGGTRMHEGTPAFVLMVDITRAVTAHKAAGLPYFVYLRHPTTGGVFASWASLGHASVVEPHALVGFLGPSVYETIHEKPFPEGVQLSENLFRKGIVDAVVPPDQLADIAARTLTLLSRREPREVPPASEVEIGDHDAWESIQLTRRDDRPGVRALLKLAADDVIPLNGTGEGEADDTLMLALASLRGLSCVVIGQDRNRQSRHRMGPAALRSARRGMAIAKELSLPLVCVIDTPGADLSADAEEGAIAGEIARCLADMTQLDVPSVSVLLGEGTGGGALALFPGRRIVAAEHSWLSPLPPEGASAIVHHDVDHAPEMARRQRVRAVDLRDAGLVHEIVPEPTPAHEATEEFVNAIVDACVRQLAAQM